MKKDDIFNILVKHVYEFIGALDENVPEISRDTYFVNLGANSCDRAVIASEMIENLSVQIPLEEILTVGTVGEMAELLYLSQVSAILCEPKISEVKAVTN